MKNRCCKRVRRLTLPLIWRSLPNGLGSAGLLIVLLFIGSLWVFMPSAYAAVGSATLTEWTVPTPRSGVWSLSLDTSGNCCWFLEYFGNKVGHLDPATNMFQEWTIPISGANPYSIAITTISGSLTLWGTEFGADKIFMFSPTSGLFREYNVTYGSGVGYISVEPSNGPVRVWFTEMFRNVNGEAIYDPSTGNVTLYQDEFPVAVGGGAYGVYATSNSVWFAGFSALVRWDRASNQYTMWPLPVHGSAVGRFITLDQNGEPWFTQGVTDGNSTNNYLGVLRGNTTLQEWQIPSAGSDPRGISIDSSIQRVWVAEESQAAGNGGVASLIESGGGRITSPVVTTALSAATPTVLSPILSLENVSSTSVIPTTRLVAGSASGSFVEYAVGQVQPHEALVDSKGDVWISEPGVNEIARLSHTGSDFALNASPPMVTLPQGGSEGVTVSGVSISGYAGHVTLAVRAVPPNVTVSVFSPGQLNVPSGGTGLSKLVIRIAPEASGETGVITIQGTDGNLTRTMTVIVMITNSTVPAASNGLKCLIATATYGSELSPEVQLLRNFRDNSLAKSRVGSSFLIVFNAWYYSFSPSVADFISTHEVLRSVMQVGLYPLIAFLSLASLIYGELSAYPEWATVVSGLVACSLIGGFYVGLPLGLIARRRLMKRKLNLTALGVVLLGPVAMILVGEVLLWRALLMISSSLVVFSALTISGLVTAKAVSCILP